MAGKVDVNQLVARASEKKQSRYCFAHYLEGQAAEYVERVTALHREQVADGRTGVNGSQVQRDLEEFFGIEANTTMVRAHLNDRCKTCRKPR